MKKSDVANPANVLVPGGLCSSALFLVGKRFLALIRFSPPCATSLQAKGKKPLFVQLVLDNIWSLYDAVVIRRLVDFYYFSKMSFYE